MRKGENADLSPLQREMKRLLDRQKEALQKPCSFCWGALERENIIQLVCPACQKLFNVEELLADNEKEDALP